MSPNPTRRAPSHRLWRGLFAAASMLLIPAMHVAGAQAAPTPAGLTNPPGSAQDSANRAAADSVKPLSPDQLDALIAPIALYPDDLLMQTLVASTYPLELIQLSQWLAKNPSLKDKALADSVAKQPWDPAIQSMAAIPEVVKRLSDDIQWTTDLGNAFLANQAGVMDAAQRMRKKAKDKGALTSNEHQTVETKVVEKQTVIVVESTNPQVVFVPSYSPTVVYGPAPYPYYPYPPIYYPPYPPGGMMVAFGVGMMWGAAIWGGSCCHAGWHGGGSTVIINNNNNFNQINHNRNNVGNTVGGGNNNWSHDASHRGGAPYGDKATANKYGGSARGESPSAGQLGAGGGGTRSPSASTRPSGGAGGAGAAGGMGGAGASTRPSGGGSMGGAGASTRPSGGSMGGGTSASTRPSGGFGGGSGGYSGASARTSGSRGASSMGSRGGGGGGRRR